MKAHIKIDKMFWLHILGSVLRETVLNTKIGEMACQKLCLPVVIFLSTCNTS